MIRPIPAVAAIALAAGALGACHHGGQVYGPPNGNLCRPFHTSDGPQINPSDQAALFDDCLHRWAYSLAPARDDAGAVVAAVNAACTSALTRWNQQSLSQQSATAAPPGSPPAPGGPPPSQAIDLATGQPTDLMGARAQFAQGRAMFYVIEARAGGCAAPPEKPPAGEP